MRRASTILALFLVGCSSTRRAVDWEKIALAAAAADIVSTQAALGPGTREANPIYGRHPGIATPLAVNAALHEIVRLAMRGTSDEHRQSVWRAVAAVRFAVVAYNLTRR